MSFRIRTSLDREDWAFAREVCCRTADGTGGPIDRARWPFFGEQWVGPYERLRPEWTYVAEEGARLGYLTGCPDTSRFEREKRWLFDLPLYLRTTAGGFAANGDVATFRRRFRAEILGDLAHAGPRDRFPAGATRAVVAEYPAHLHVNLVAETRGKGVGRRLVDRYREDLVAVGVRGIHLYCGERPRPFYEKIGFSVLDRIEFRPGVPVYRLGSRF